MDTMFESYLNKLGDLKPVQLGKHGKIPPISEDVLEKSGASFKELLLSQIKFNNGIILTAVIGLVIIFIIDIYFIFYYRDDLKALAFLFGGTFLSLIGVIRWLRKLWMDKTVMDVTLGVIQDLPPEVAMQHIQVTYWRIIRGEKS